MNEVAAAYAATGRAGPKAATEMGALLQMISRTSGGASETSTNFERMMATITSEKVKELQDFGIKIFDADALARGRKEFRAIPDIVKDIIRKTKGDEEKLGQVFDIRGLRAMRAFAAEFKSGNEFVSLDKFLSMKGDTPQLLGDAATNANTAAAAMTNLYTAWKRFADSGLTGPIQSLADVLNSLGSETTGKVIKGLAIGAGALGAAVVARKTYTAGKSIIGTLTGKGGAAAAGALGGGLPVPLPVYIVNAPPGGLGGTGGASGGISPKGGKLAALGTRVGQVAGLSAAYGAGYMYGSYLNDQINSFVSKMAGRDATLGTLIYDALHRDPMKSEVTIKIDSNGTPRVAGMSTSSRAMEINVDAGLRGAGS